MKRVHKQPVKDVDNMKTNVAKCFEILSIINGAEKDRLKEAVKYMNEQNDKIKKLESCHSIFKDTVIKHLKESYGNNRLEHHVILRAIEEYNIDGPNLDELIESKISNSKMTEVDSNKENICQYGNKTIIGMSPIKKIIPAKILNEENSSFIQSHLFKIDSCNQFSSISPIKNTNSFAVSTPIATNKVTRFNQRHEMGKDLILKKKCSNCCEQNNKTHMHRCDLCSIYVHDTCLKPKLCIPLHKVISKITLKPKSLSLNELCCDNNIPMVPNIFLVIMNRIHMAGLQTENIYLSEGKEKVVKELCNKLLEGQLKYLYRYDIRIVSNAFIMLLCILQDSLLPMSLINKLKSFSNMDTTLNERRIAKCLNELPKTVRDTLIFVLVHLKVVSEHPQCKFNSERLAKMFTPYLMENGPSNMTIIHIVIMLIDLDTTFYYTYFKSASEFFGPYLKELKSKNYPSLIEYY